MNATLGSNNPLAWVHFQLRGGWKRALMFTIGGCIMLGALMMLSVIQTSPMRSYSGAMESSAQGLLVLEGAILILYGGTAIAQSIRNDITGGLIESHRLMPVSAPRAVIGYLVGGGGPAMVMASGVMFLDLFAALSSQLPIDRWLLAQAALAGLAVVAWMVCAVGAFLGGRAGVGWMIALIAVSFSSGMFVDFFPGLIILIGPSFARMSLRGWGGSDAYFPIALAMQAVLFLLFFLAAMRRYAREDLTSLGVLPALGLVALWVGMSMVGIEHYPALVTRSYDRVSLSTQCVATLAVLMLLCLLPIANAARLAAQSHSSLTPRRDRLLPWVAIAASLVLTLLLSLMIQRMDDWPWMVVVQTCIVVGAWLLAMRFLLGWVYKAVNSGFLIAFVWTLLTWFAPMVGDVILQSILHPNDNYVAGSLFAVSPLGALIQIWSNTTPTPPDVTLGLAIQIALILIPLLLFARRGRAPKLMKPVPAA